MVSEPIASLILALIAVTTSAWLTGRVRAYALARQLLDVPNVRSSHSTPTARGGGVAIVIAVLLVLVVGVALKVMEWRLAVALGGGGLLVAWVGWWDDHTGLRPRVRAAGHAVAGIWALYWLGGYPAMRLGDFVVTLGPAGSLLALIGIVWAVNLFNFMDGIDGIAGVEAVTVGTGGALLLWAAGESGGASASLAIAAAALGFLFWNWAPARIFMGDAGSGFLGFSFAVLAIWSENTHGPPVILWGILAMVFVFDATVTLIRRALRHEALAEPHRGHAYQRLVQAGKSHAVVTGAVLGLNLLLILLVLSPGMGPVPALGMALAVCGGAYLIVEILRPM
jgi:Fuc2NAc and GlcNAc transferase